jgi:hypothetical protein
MSKIKDIVQGMIDSTLSAFKWLTDLSSLVGPLLSFLKSPVFRLLFMNPIFLGLATLAAIAAYLIKYSTPEGNQETAEGLAKAADVSTESAAIMATQEPTDENLVQKRKVRLLAERPSNKKSLAFWRDSELQKKYLEEIGFDEKTGLTAKEKEMGFTGLDEDANPIKKPTTISNTTSVPDESDAETARLARQNAAAAPKPATETKAEPVSTPSNQLNTVMAANVEANLPAKTDNETQSIVNNLVQNSNNQQQKIAKLDEISVHNDEPTFMRMIMGSTRLV